MITGEDSPNNEIFRIMKQEITKAKGLQTGFKEKRYYLKLQIYQLLSDYRMNRREQLYYFSGGNKYC